MIVHCFNNIEAHSLGKQDYDWKCFIVHFLNLLLHWQYVWDQYRAEKTKLLPIRHFQTLTVLVCIHSSNSFDKISNTTAWNPAPNHDRASVVFKR